MPEKQVEVPEVKPAIVPQGRALRIALGRFVVRWIETFAGTLVGVTLFMPQDAADWQKLLAVLVPPSVTATYQAGRAAWPALKAFLLAGQPET